MAKTGNVKIKISADTSKADEAREKVAADILQVQLMPYGDAILENMRMVSEGRRDQSSLDDAIEAWVKHTQPYR